MTAARCAYVVAMRCSMFFTLWLVASLSACGGGDDLAGTWTFDLKASMKALEPDLARVAPGPARQDLRSETLRVIEEALAEFQVTLTLEAGGRATVTGAGRASPRTLEAKWRFDAARQEVVVTTGDRDQRYSVDGDQLGFPIEVPEIDGGKLRTLRVILTRS